MQNSFLVSKTRINRCSTDNCCVLSGKSFKPVSMDMKKWILNFCLKEAWKIESGASSVLCLTWEALYIQAGFISLNIMSYHQSTMAPVQSVSEELESVHTCPCKQTIAFSVLGAYGELRHFRSIMDQFSATTPTLSFLRPLFNCGLILELINIHKCSSGS